MPTVFISMLPVPKPRQTRADKWKKRPQVERYRAFCDELRLKCNVAGIRPEQFGQPFGARFYMPVPKSLQHEIKMGRKRLPLPYVNKPDVDNLLKALLDALLDEDCFVYDVHVQKFYGTTAGILLVFDEPLNDYPP